MARKSDLTLTGVYTVRDASLFTRVPTAKIRGWLRGYAGTTPILMGQLEPEDGQLALGFLDLMEVRFVNHFQMQGVKWSTIRASAQRLRDHLGHDHPFAAKFVFVSDGVDIFQEIAGAHKDKVLLIMSEGQLTWRQAIEPVLLDGIKFDDKGIANLWYPSQSEPQVVLNPKRSFGAPIVEKEGVPTYTLHQAFLAEGS
ncbi:MAG: hypothetical protein ACE5MG_05610, partial [Candidatus Methylomirabilales bacterium]